jgi:hypothetical protein
MKLFLIIIISFLFFCSCKEDKQFLYFDKICNDSLLNKVDSSRKKASYPIKANNEYLALKDIDVKSDTFFLRIEYAPDSVNRLFEFTYYKSQTTYKIYNFPIEYSGKGKIKFDNKKDKLIDYTTVFTSKEKDERFMIELEKSDLISLSHSVDIKDYPDNDYSHYYEVQFSNKCWYNFYYFGGAFENSTKFIEAKKFADFLTYLKRDFNF